MEIGRVILISQSSSCSKINVDVPQGSIVDDMSLLSTTKVPDRTVNNLDNELKEINYWAFL